MKFLVMSDLHYEANGTDMNFQDDYDVALLAGDIASSSDTLEYIFDTTFKDKDVVFVGGNHLYYKVEPMEITNSRLKGRYPNNNRVTFLENDYKIIGNNVIIGCNLFTNYALKHPKRYHDDSKEYTKKEYITANTYFAERRINDFLYSNILDKNGSLINITPKDHIKWFNQSIRYIDLMYNKFKDTHNIIVMTHYVPTFKLQSPKFNNSSITAAFISDLDNFIIEHPKIRYWICGHTHARNIVKVGETQIICNPYGIERFNETDGFEPIIFEI